MGRDDTDIILNEIDRQWVQVDRLCGAKHSLFDVDPRGRGEPGQRIKRWRGASIAEQSGWAFIDPRSESMPSK